MVTVEADAAAVERRLAAGGIACPDCGGVLGPWAWAGRRVLRGQGGVPVPVRPRRARCRGCGRSHVLLPVFALLRRADAAVVICAVLVDLDPDPVPPDAAGSVFADAVAAIVAVAGAVGRRFVPSAGCWQSACAVSGGRLLAPGWPNR